MKIEEEVEDIAREIRVLIKIRNSMNENEKARGSIPEVIDYGFMALKGFSDLNKDEIKTFGYYMMPLYDINL